MRYTIRFFNVSGNKIAEHEEFEACNGAPTIYSFGYMYIDDSVNVAFANIRNLIDRFRAKDPRIVRFTIDVTL